jgi:hypothetical protein
VKFKKYPPGPIVTPMTSLIWMPAPTRIRPTINIKLAPGSIIFGPCLPACLPAGSLKITLASVHFVSNHIAEWIPEANLAPSMKSSGKLMSI